MKTEPLLQTENHHKNQTVVADSIEEWYCRTKNDMKCNVGVF